MGAAHAVDAAAGRRRGRAEVDRRVRRRVRLDEAPRRPGEQLAEVHPPAADVAADVVRVGRLELGRAGRPELEDPLAAARREPLDLGQDRLGHVGRRAVRNVAVGPDGVAAGGRPRPVEAAGLGEQDERPLGEAALRDEPLGPGDLLERAAEVDRAGLGQLRGAPRDVALDREVQLEDARAVAVALERPAVRRRERLARDRGEPPRGDVEEGHLMRRQVLETGHPVVPHDPAAEQGELRLQRGGELGRAALRRRPAVDVGRREHDERCRPADRLGQAEDRMGGGSREQPPGPGALEAASQARRRADRVQPERGETDGSHRMKRDPERTEDSRHEVRPVLDERSEEAPVGRGVPGAAGSADVELGRRRRDVPPDEHGGPVVEGMAERRRRLDPPQPVTGQVERREERRDPAERMDRAADVVAEAGQRQLGGPHPAADRRGALEHRDLPAVAGEADRGRQAVRAAADDDRVDRRPGGDGATPGCHRSSTRARSSRRIGDT